MNFFKSIMKKYRIAKCERGDGKTYYVPQVRKGLRFKSIHADDDPGYSGYGSALNAIMTYDVKTVSYDYPKVSKE